MLNRKKIIFYVFMLLLIPGLLSAQSFQKIDNVDYLQLPAVDDAFSSAEIFITLDNSAAAETVSFGLGKLGIGGDSEDSKGSSIDDFVKEVFANQTEKYATWDLFEDFTLNENTGMLKIVLTFAPDNSAKPMMEPMKNKDGLYQFNYRTNSSMQVYDASEKLLYEKEFAAISGTAVSKSWDKGATSMVSVSDSDEVEYTPYEAGCRDGVVQYAKRVIYGMYGIKRLQAPLGVAEIKKQKDSKKVQRDFNDLIANRKGILLDVTEMTQAQAAIEYWESILESTREEYLWAVHYNLAIAYGWVLDAEKSQQHIEKVAELNSDIFDKIKNKSGSFRGKDLDMLEAYNNGQPFCQYFAAGINKYPSISKMLDIDAYRVAHTMTINEVLSNIIDLPVALPLFPYHEELGMKKCEGEISYQGEVIASFDYDLEKKNIVGLSIKGTKNSKLDDLKESVSLTSAADLSPNEKRRVYYNLGVPRSSGYYGLTDGPTLFLNDYNRTSKSLLPIYRLPDVAQNQEITLEGGQFKNQFTDAYFIAESITSGNQWFSNRYDFGDSMAVEFVADKTILKAEALNVGDNGIPAQYKVSMDVKDASLILNVKIKSKFGETTNAEQTRRIREQSRLEPTIRQIVMDHLSKTADNLQQGEKHFSFTYSHTYDLESKTDDKGNWTELKIGDYTISREIKY
ncbi:MAG: hypothetical protein R6U84_01805 [Candidatus Cloacimonadales bacterium]